ncbi:Aste57867_9718 [Aphanomyces stellatus]|uniref:Aste57867_9718 protein n=1 Tax=Aphanomyces stellatus TaxID=120398 RepID=A0A485KP11_9STRA|nr:hypothetical protein As57867_009680 [Aphanomyces stellatus]VFT86597.1 Aste57867_9718 [Aphanomyces stellatus]
MQGLDDANVHALRLKYRQDKVKARRKRADESAALDRQIAELQQRLVEMRRRRVGLLSWQDVSVALRDELIQVSFENTSLSRQVNKQRAVAEALGRWVRRVAQEPVATISLGSNNTWQHSTLLLASDTTSRVLAMQWILQQMHVHTDRALALSPTPHLHEPAAGAWTEDVRAVVAADQDDAMAIHYRTHGTLVLPCGLQAASDFLWFDNPNLLPTCDKMYVDDNVMYVREGASKGAIRLVGHILYGRQLDADRAVHVSRSIVCDEQHPLEETEWTVPTLDWFVLERINDHQTRLRYVTQGHPPSHPDRGLAPFTHFNLDRSERGHLTRMVHMIEFYHRGFHDRLQELCRVARKGTVSVWHVQ